MVAVDDDSIECLWLGDDGELFRETIDTHDETAHVYWCSLRNLAVMFDRGSDAVTEEEAEAWCARELER